MKIPWRSFLDKEFVVGERQRLLLPSKNAARHNRSRLLHHNKIADGVVTVTSLEMKNHRSVCSSAVKVL